MSTAAHRNHYSLRADEYHRAHALWLRYAGGEAQCAFEGAVAALLQPGMAMLDAACGTGAMARRLLTGVTGSIDLAVLDACPCMLRECGGIPAQRIQGRIENLPFRRQSFDLVTCAWGIETLQDPKPALAEFIRVTRSSGHICLVFCSDLPARSLIGTAMRQRIVWRRLGRFLNHVSVSDSARELGAKRVRTLHCSGPATAMILYI